MPNASGILTKTEPRLDLPLLNLLQDIPLVCWHSVTPGYVCAHHHPGVEYLYIHTGSGVFVIGDHTLPFTAPVLICFPSKVPHGIKVWGSYDRWCMCYVPEALQAALPPSQHQLLHHPEEIAMVNVPERYQKRLLDIYSALLSERDECARFAYDIISLHLQEISYLFRRLQDTDSLFAGKTSETSQTPLRNERIAQLLGMIEARLDEDLSASELAHSVHYSRSQLYRIVREATGLSFASYLRNRRIERAKQLLKVTDLSISEIAARVGIPQLSQFYRNFRKQTNTTPKEYRANTAKAL